MPIPLLHIYVNDDDPNQLLDHTPEKEWTLPLSQIRKLLEFLDTRVDPGCALIDGYEPLLYGKPLLHLIASLRLYGWDPSVMTRGAFISHLENPKQKLEILYRAGLSCLQLYFTEAILQKLGLEGIEQIFLLINNGPITIASHYYYDGNGPHRAVYLQGLMHNLNFNRISHMLYIDSLENQDQVLRQKNKNVEQELFPRFIVGHKGTLALSSTQGEKKFHCSLLADGWQSIVDGWLVLPKREADAAVS